MTRFAVPPHPSQPPPSVPAAVGFISEDEYLEITGITREQSGEYECSASNDVAAPVVQRVKVTVNCEYPGGCWGWDGDRDGAGHGATARGDLGSGANLAFRPWSQDKWQQFS